MRGIKCDIGRIIKHQFYVNSKAVSSYRCYSIQAAPKPLDDHQGTDTTTRTDREWITAKPFSEVPRVNRLSFLWQSLPGGRYHKLPLAVQQNRINEDYGPIVYLEGYIRRRGIVFVFDPESYETVFRADGMWPIRNGLDTLVHYRKNVRPDIFKNAGGLMTDQGKSWADFRTKVNPLLLKPNNLKQYIPMIDEISSDFLQRLRDIRDPQTLELTGDVENQTNHWSLESVGGVALNTRLGLLDPNNPTDRGERLMTAVKKFFQLSYELDILPSIWKYYETPKLAKLMQAFDTMTDTFLECINEAKVKIEKNPDDPSILAQILKQDEHAAVVMAMDLLIAGIDTTSSAVLSCLYRLAVNPDKQEILRKEVLKVLPQKQSPVTAEALKNLPYLRACMKEMFRQTGIASGTMRELSQDIVLHGYQIPKGTQVLMAAATCTSRNEYFADADKFIPERWLRQDIQESQACPWGKPKNPYAYIPFGFGSRMCVGKRLAELEIETMLLKIMRNFKVEWHYPEMQYRSNLINTPTGDLKFKLIDLP